MLHEPSGSLAFALVVPLALVASLSAMGCRQPVADSNVKTLDGLVDKAEGGDAKVNSCGVAFTSVDDLPEAVQILYRNGRIKGSAAMKKEVMGTLAATPVDLLRPFVAAGGVIRVEASALDAERACKPAPLTDDERAIATVKIESCWLANPAVIVLPPDASRIRTDLLRQLSYFFTEYFLDRSHGQAGTADQPEAQAWLAGVAATRATLATAFMSDIEVASPAAHQRLNATLSPERRGNFIYAEALDSYYCSKQTAEAFKTRFPKTWAVFTDKANSHSPVRIFGE